MILDRKVFSFKGKVLIEKLTISPPFTYKTIFQNEGCFLYLSGIPTTFNAPTQQTKLESKEAVLLKCGTYFVEWLKEQSPNKCMVYAIHLYPDVLKSIYRNELPAIIQEKQSPNYIQKIILDNTLTQFIDNLDFYFENESLVNDDLIELKIKELVLLLLQTKNADSVHQLIAELFTPKKITIREVVQNHLYSNLTIENLAELSNLSTSTFKREFKKLFDDSPIHYINQKRLIKSKELLRLSEKSISEIAYDLGFSDPGYFTRLFKKEYHISPKDFRQTF